MSRRSAKQPSSFLWQGLLILLPVAVLAAVGVYALRQDQRLVEQEARQRASEIARDLSERLGRQVASELSTFELNGSLWAGAGGIGGPIYWPGRSPLNTDNLENYKKLAAEWQAKYSALRPADVFPVRAALAESGQLQHPRDYSSPPMPPPWLYELSAEQKSLWDKACQMRFNSSDVGLVRTACREFLETNPPAPAKANAEFILLQLDIQKIASAERIERLLRFGHKHGFDLSESGLPLSAVALARAFNEAAETGLTEDLFDELTGWKSDPNPSILTSLLLNAAQKMADRQSQPIREAVAELRLRWESSERLRGLARRVQEIIQPVNIISTNLWLDWGAQRWLAILDPGESHVTTSTNGRRITTTNRLTNIRFYPLAAVKQAVKFSLDRLPITKPAYLAVKVLLENEMVLDTTPSSAIRPLVLARNDGSLSLPGVMQVGTNPDGTPKVDRQFETLPSHPRLAIEIVLSDAPLLYARAGQRASIFGATILAAAAAALIGLVMARRAFFRQIRLNEMKSNFVSSVSHELRAPIASVRLMAEGLESGRIKDEAKKRDYFKFIVQECRRLTSLIENVLDFSRIEQNRKQYEFEPTDLPALVQHTVKFMETYAAERGVSLELNLGNSQPSTFNSQPSVYGRALQQALVNLIDNAIKHSTKGAAVQVGLDFSPSATANSGGVDPASRLTSHVSRSDVPHSPLPASRVRLWVEDHGEGIPPTEHERIFERFYRRGSELRRETQGVGIGLSIVKHIVEAHGGRVSVRSAVGQGSRFTIELPVSQ